MENQLHRETSPYLLQHSDNPVAWRAWDEAALAEARQANKPILLSIGYSACHWCHVMAHESFEDRDTASLMNELYVNIKVDREERPDIDKIYQLAHQIMNGRGGGWPLTAFLTPDGHLPIFIGTYFPREPRYGMPAFSDVLRNVARYYREHDEAVRSTGLALRQALASIEPARGNPLPSPLDGAPLRQARQGLARSFDGEHGGFGAAPKFPHPTHLEFLLDCWRHSAEQAQPDLDALRMTALSLTRMAERGLFDHLGGGFFRYCVDAYWMIPHFEKMLYDNAALLALYAQAHAATGEALFARTAEATAEWVLRDMQHPEGAFYTALDADAEGQEGRFYVWRPEEISAVLDDTDRALFCGHFGLDAPANFESLHWHLHIAQPLEEVAQQQGLEAAQAGARIAQARARLLALRNQRTWPGRDDKILTSWNGLMIRGLAIAARALQRPELAEQATRAVDFLRRSVWRDGRLFASFKDGRARFPGYLDDHAFLADALVELLQCRWRTEDLDLARALVEALLERFEDSEGGFYFTANDHENLLHRPKPYQDEAMPSGNALAAGVLQRLGHLLGEHRYLDAANRLLVNAWPLVQRYPEAHCGLLRSLRAQLEPPVLIVIRGEAPALEHWQRYVHAGYHPHRLAFCIPNDAGPLPGLLSEYASRDTTVAYVCRGTRCEAPVESLEALLAELGQRPDS